MNKLDYDIKDEYSHELNEIGDILRQLKNRRVYEISYAKMDGYLATNVEKLEQKICYLLSNTKWKRRIWY